MRHFGTLKTLDFSLTIRGMFTIPDPLGVVGASQPLPISGKGYGLLTFIDPYGAGVHTPLAMIGSDRTLTRDEERELTYG